MVNFELLIVFIKFFEKELDFRNEWELDSVKNFENESKKDGGKND